MDITKPEKLTEFETGAVRDQATGKPDFSLVSPYFFSVYEYSDHDFFNHICSFMKSGKISDLIQSAVNLIYEENSTNYEALVRLSNHLEQGAIKYSRFNWAKGMDISRTLASLLRHAVAYIKKEEDDDHFAAVLCNIMFIVHTKFMINTGKCDKKLDNYPYWETEEWRSKIE